MHLPVESFKQGCSLLIKIKSTELRLLKLDESSIRVYIQISIFKITNKKRKKMTNKKQVNQRKCPF
jgi:hypothetical protein